MVAKSSGTQRPDYSQPYDLNDMRRALPPSSRPPTVGLTSSQFCSSLTDSFRLHTRIRDAVILTTHRAALLVLPDPTPTEIKRSAMVLHTVPRQPGVGIVDLNLGKIAVRTENMPVTGPDAKSALKDR